MMITKERLKELIEKKVTIYALYGKRVVEIKLYKDYKFKLNNEGLNDIWLGGDFHTDFDFNSLFETKPEAEFYAKYGNVEKTVKMPVPPTWEEFKKKKAYAFKKDEDVFLLKQDRYDGNDMFIIDKITFGEHKNIKTWHFVEDFETIYYKALDKMVELWKEKKV